MDCRRRSRTGCTGDRRVENGQLRLRGNAGSAGGYAFLQQSGTDAWGIGQQALYVRRSGEPDLIGSRFGLPVSHAAAPR
jgi:hypothetical protein